jgi:proteasome alpha subunit
MKPYEVEILVGEVDGEESGTAVYHILFDGSVTDEHGFVAIGGHAEDLMDSLRTRFSSGWDLATAVKSAVEVLGSPESRTIEADAIEAGVLDRTRTQRRKFRRLEGSEIARYLAG